MGNCLVTKLKGIVDNPLLPKLDELVLHVSSRDDYSWKVSYLQLACGSLYSYSIEIVGNGVFTNTTFEDLNDPSKTMTSGTFQGTASDQEYYFSDGDYYVKIKGKDVIYRFRLQKFGSASSTCFDIKTSDMIGFTELTTLTLARTNIDGSIEELGNLINLTALDTTSSIITGEINVLAQRQVTAGRTSGTLKIYCNNYITLNGEATGDDVVKTITFKSSGYSVS